ncbi:serine hydrolase domain-containing protein [Terrimonas rubra]|uniref:Serine hydrolase domain-containing protein n=1 Tax=Terrimonas rubra TaxID=1035890 RepID=A0ABW6A1R6_9BACT
MLNSFSLIFRLCLLIVVPVVSTAQQLPDSTIAQLKSGIAGFKDRYPTPSIVVAIVHGKEIVFSESLGYVDVENKVAATIDSRYPILSVTKTFTATMFMQLVQRNKILLEEDIRKYLPEYKGDKNRVTETGISFLQLATHTSGMPRNTPADVNFAKQVDRWLLNRTYYASLEPSSKKELLQSLQYIKKVHPEYQLLSYGDRQYSNLGYSMLGIALERAAKQDYSEYIVNNICKPLQMTSSGIGTESFGSTVVAKGYYFDEHLQQFVKTPVFHSNSALYAGGMYSTAKDLAKYISFQFDTSSAANKILSLKNRRMMQSLRIGWKPSYPIVLHEGGMLGYRCLVAFYPDLEIGWVILTNTTDFEFDKMNEYIGKLVSPIYKKPAPEMTKFVGTYRLQGGFDSLNIYVKDGRLYSTYLEKELPQQPLIANGNNRFKAQTHGSYSIGYNFLTNDMNGIKAVVMGQLTWVKDKD